MSIPSLFSISAAGIAALLSIIMLVQGGSNLSLQSDLQKRTQEIQTQQQEVQLQQQRLQVENELLQQRLHLTNELEEQRAIKDARRDYEYDAKKRLYAECEPLVFQALELAESARFRIIKPSQKFKASRCAFRWFGLACSPRLLLQVDRLPPIRARHNVPDAAEAADSDRPRPRAPPAHPL